MRAREAPMRRTGLVLVVGCVAAISFAARSQTSNAPQPPAQASTPAQELPKTYLPGLGEFMGRIQVDHAKLWLVRPARNWELADYELTELKEVFSDVQDFVPRYQNVPVGDMIDAIITGTMTELDKAISARGFHTLSSPLPHHPTAHA